MSSLEYKRKIKLMNSHKHLFTDSHALSLSLSLSPFPSLTWVTKLTDGLRSRLSRKPRPTGSLSCQDVSQHTLSGRFCSAYIRSHRSFSAASDVSLRSKPPKMNRKKEPLFNQKYKHFSFAFTLLLVQLSVIYLKHSFSFAESVVFVRKKNFVHWLLAEDNKEKTNNNA